MWCGVQRGRQLSHQRKQLTLFQQPLRTLYYFWGCMGSAGARSLVWLAHSPITLFILLPCLLAYISLKYTGKTLCDKALVMLLLAQGRCTFEARPVLKRQTHVCLVSHGLAGALPPITLFLQLPCLLAYSSLKHTGKIPV